MDRNWKEHERLQRHDFAAVAFLVAPTPEAILATQKLTSKKHSERSSPPLPCESLAKPCSTAPIRLLCAKLENADTL